MAAMQATAGRGRGGIEEAQVMAAMQATADPLPTGPGLGRGRRYPPHEKTVALHHRIVNILCNSLGVCVGHVYGCSNCS